MYFLFHGANLNVLTHLLGRHRMKKSAYGKAIYCMLVLGLIGCDSVEPKSQSHVETRAMIIAGMPVHEQHYSLPKAENAWNEAQLQTALD